MVLEEYGEELPEQEAGAYELSIRMHAGRLREIPRQREEARARKLIQDRKREEWEKRGRP
jgi:nitroimidazol reductase NimA-like FMN-containing flavoprotein (pyridoxamine 5'-phosphate oxidase superfamily)